jgi:hypothetical protein
VHSTLDESVERAFMDHVGLEVWNDPTVAWDRRGVEHDRPRDFESGHLGSISPIVGSYRLVHMGCPMLARARHLMPHGSS